MLKSEFRRRRRRRVERWHEKMVDSVYSLLWGDLFRIKNTGNNVISWWNYRAITKIYCKFFLCLLARISEKIRGRKHARNSCNDDDDDDDDDDDEGRNVWEDSGEKKQVVNVLLVWNKGLWWLGKGWVVHDLCLVMKSRLVRYAYVLEAPIACHIGVWAAQWLVRDAGTKRATKSW